MASVRPSRPLVRRKVTRCMSRKYSCSRVPLNSYQYCEKHILEAKNTPFKQCSYTYSQTGEKCPFAVISPPKNPAQNGYLLFSVTLEPFSFYLQWFGSVGYAENIPKNTKLVVWNLNAKFYRHYLLLIPYYMAYLTMLNMVPTIRRKKNSLALQPMNYSSKLKKIRILLWIHSVSCWFRCIRICRLSIQLVNIFSWYWPSWS